jgi:hypothetical protein
MREKTSFCSGKWYGWLICLLCLCLLWRECRSVGMLEVCQRTCTIVCLTRYLFSEIANVILLCCSYLSCPCSKIWSAQALKGERFPCQCASSKVRVIAVHLSR